MVFSSIEFIFIFFPLFMLSYYSVSEHLKNIWLFVGSLLFYTLGSLANLEYVLLFGVSLVFNYYLGIWIEQYSSKNLFRFGVGVNLLYLGCFKYIFHILPIGISFYTFQAISYLYDIRKGRCKADRSFVNFGTYLSMFPQLIAGPIVKYPDIKEQLLVRKHNLYSLANGLEIFILGLGSKVLLANQVGGLWTQLSAIGYESISTPLAWLGLLAYSFQIYFDFWGYSLMAIGLGKMLGFDLPKNFDNPYLSTSMTEFWRRWHMTLGNWFKEYVYIPLGGNRGSNIETYRNLLVVWLFTGIWHGAGWNFVLWGVILFVLIVIERIRLKKILDKYKVLGHLYMIAVIPLTWAVFANNEWNKMIIFFQRLFGYTVESGIIFSGDYLKYGKEYGVSLFVCLLFVIKLPQKVWEKLKDTYFGQILLVGIFICVVYFLYIGLDNPFLYYQF